MNLKRNLIVVDVEADGPCPGLYSIVCFGAVHVNSLQENAVFTPNLQGNTFSYTYFYGQCAPLEWADVDPWYRGEKNYVKWDPEALKISGFTREEHLKFPHPQNTFIDFNKWVRQFDRPVFVSDNPAFDWQFINWYFHQYISSNPFGYSARRIGDFWAGLNRDWDDHNSWKNSRKTAHDHNPVNDARGNAEALLSLLSELESQEFVLKKWGEKNG